MVLEYPAPLHVLLRDVVGHVVRLVLVRPETVPLVPLLGENSLGIVLNSDLVLEATLASQMNISPQYTKIFLLKKSLDLLVLDVIKVGQPLRPQGGSLGVLGHGHLPLDAVLALPRVVEDALVGAGQGPRERRQEQVGGGGGGVQEAVGGTPEEGHGEDTPYLTHNIRGYSYRIYELYDLAKYTQYDQ